jgi:hypothetical protein
MANNAQSLGAYYQCHKNAASFIRTLKSFQQFYTNSDIVVVNDGGYDYKEFCEKRNIWYIYKPKSETMNNALIFGSYDACIFFLKNLFESFKKIKETHILLLEDDVRVLKNHSVPFQYTINGCNEKEHLDIVLQKILQTKGYNGPYYFGACGGCVLEKSFFENIDFAEIENLIYKIKDFPNLFASDILLSFIVLYFGGTIGQHDEFAEMWYHDIYDRVNNNKTAFLHQYKTDYEKCGVFPTDKEMLELGNYV